MSLKITSEMLYYNTIKIIKDNQYSNLSKSKKEYFDTIILKALVEYGL